MAGVLSALLGAGSDGQLIGLPVSYYQWADKYSAVEQYGADVGYFSSLGGGIFSPVAWQGRTIRAVVHSYDLYAATSTTLIGLDGYNATPAPQLLRINGTLFTLGAGSIAWATNVTGITFSPSPTNNINWTSHGLAVGDPVQFYCTGGMPSGITAFTIYFVQSVVSSSAFKIAATPGGAAISFTGSGSGTRYGYKNPITAYQVNGALAGNVFAAMLPRTATITVASPATVTATGHGLANGDRVQFTTSGALPTGILANTTYVVINAATDTFNLSATQGGAAIGTSGGQSGSHIVREVVSVTVI
ncbi:MAG: hypothetical protein K2W86_00450 [Sphingomonas sp.]|uniref:hypothetical protein n=1 Tax=Sphingomonas sp. TaxID=28214 RepID=UPI0035A90DAF|nr:hypothetical protein [Sphingomonas sp.]